jgi:hypothetical protein
MLSDIYWGSQINWVCDNVWIIPYQPALLNIDRYGTDTHEINELVPNDGRPGIPTQNLVVGSCVKSRKGRVGDLYLINDLGKSGFVEI